jgi:MFS family permease
VGREFGVVYAIISVTHILGPFLAGWISQVYGFTATFTIASLIQLGSIFPLFQAKEVFVPKIYSFRQTLELYRQFPKKAIGYLGFGEELLVLVIWPIFIYMTVRNYEETGFIATLASFAAAVLAIIIGKITDQYTKRLLIKIGAFFSSIVWIARLVPATSASVLAIDTLSRTSKEMAFIPISTVTYIRAEETHVVPYVVFFEQALAIGKLLAALLGIVVFALTGSFMALFILAALFSLLYMFI